jgi:hypothetical protein
MNSKSKFIKTLTEKKSVYQYPSQAEDLANSLDTISDDIYSESERFIYELIQNADDSCADYQKGVEIHIEFTQNFIIISHTGREFSEEDITAISSVGKSQKSDKPNQTGYKGIGFKSVFGKSSCVYINSNGFCFRFDKDYWENREHKMPWQIIPIWSDSLSDELNNSYSFARFRVSTAIKYHNTQELKQSLFNLFSNTQIMLFLRNVRKITVTNTKEFVVEKIKPQGSTTAIIKKNGQIQSEWITKDFIRIAIDEDIQTELKRDDKSPKKLKESKFTNISFAAKIEDGQLVSIKENALVFTYLPTKINLGFPFLVNADFLTNAAREGFHEDRIWNKWLFKRVAVKLFEWLAELAKSNQYKYQFTRLIPNVFSTYRDSAIKAAFNSGIEYAIENIPFIPSKNGNLLKVSEALIDYTAIHEVVGIDLLTQYYNQYHHTNFTESAIVNLNIKTQHKLVQLGVKIFETKNLKDFFASDLFQANLQLEQNYELIKFLHRKATANNSRAEWNENLKSAPFIFNENRVLTPPDAPTYLPNESCETLLDTLNNSFNFIHHAIWQQIAENKEIVNWFCVNWFCNDLEITKPTQRNIIEKIIIKK